MRASIVQQWAGILAIAAGCALISLPIGLIALGILVIVNGVGRDLDERRRR